MHRLAPATCLLIVALCACSDEGSSLVGRPGPAGQGTPTPGPTVAATSEPTPAPSVTPTSAPRPVAVTIVPGNAQVWVPPAGGGTPAPGYAPTVQLMATVVLDDRSTHHTVTWTSMAPALATVDGSGWVRAIAPGAGSGPWPVQIRATAPDGQTLGVVQVLVRAEGDLEVEVD